MTSLTFISPDGKLYTHKKYVNWEGVRQVEGSGTVLPINAHTAERSMIQRDLHCKTFIDIKYCDFTIQD